MIEAKDVLRFFTLIFIVTALFAAGLIVLNAWHPSQLIENTVGKLCDIMLMCVSAWVGVITYEHMRKRRN